MKFTIQVPSPNQRADAAQYRSQLVDRASGRSVSTTGKAYSCAPHTPKNEMLSGYRSDTVCVE